MSQTIEIELSEEVFLAMQKDPKDLAKEMRLAVAVKLYELGLSQGKTAEVVGLNRTEFNIVNNVFSLDELTYSFSGKNYDLL